MTFEPSQTDMTISNDAQLTPAFSLEEDINITALRIIRDNFEHLFNTQLGGKCKIQNSQTGEYEITTDYKTALTQVNNLYKSKLMTNLVKYSYSRNINYGRRYHCSPSLQECPRPIRHTIAKDIYYDIDIKNAHPLFCYQYCKSIGFKHPPLKEYVFGDREEFLKSLIGVKIGTEIIENRDDAKSYFLKILNGGGNNNTGVELLDSFYKKHQEFLKIFYNNKDNIKYKRRAERAYEINKNKFENKFENKMASALNYYMCEIENICLEKIEKYLQINKIKYGTLCFDGVMTYKNSIIDINSFILEVNKIISAEMNYNVIITVKEMDEGLDLTGLTINENFIDESLLNDYDIMKKEFEYENGEVKRFKCMFPISYCEVKENKMIEMSSKADITERYRTKTHKVINNNKEIVKKFINTWFDDEKILTYDHFDFLPCQEVPKHVYNTFCGFEGEKASLIKDDIENSLIMKHVKNLCGNNDKMVEYLLNFLACRVQSPNRQTNTCMIFKSNEGTGKDLFFNWFSNKIIGSSYCASTADLEAIFGKFNSFASRKIFTILDEVDGSQSKLLIGKIKSAITALKIKIEYKGENPFDETNNNAFIIFTNNENCIQIKPSERRFIVAEPNNKIANDKDYFIPLIKELNKGKYNRAFYDMLLKRDIKDFNFTTERPETESYKDMQRVNVPISSLFIHETINKDNNFIDKYNKDNKNITKLNKEDIFKIKKIELFNKFLSYIETNKFKYESNAIKFGIELKKYDGIEVSPCRKYYHINKEEVIQSLIKKKFLIADEIKFIEE